MPPQQHHLPACAASSGAAPPTAIPWPAPASPDVSRVRAGYVALAVAAWTPTPADSDGLDVLTAEAGAGGAQGAERLCERHCEATREQAAGQPALASAVVAALPPAGPAEEQAAGPPALALAPASAKRTAPNAVGSSAKRNRF